MSKFLNSGVALVLIPCLITEPLSANVSTTLVTEKIQAAATLAQQINQQALMLPISAQRRDSAPHRRLKVIVALATVALTRSTLLADTLTEPPTIQTFPAWWWTIAWFAIAVVGVFFFMVRSINQPTIPSRRRWLKNVVVGGVIVEAFVLAFNPPRWAQVIEIIEHPLSPKMLKERYGVEISGATGDQLRCLAELLEDLPEAARAGTVSIRFLDHGAFGRMTQDPDVLALGTAGGHIFLHERTSLDELEGLILHEMAHPHYLNNPNIHLTLADAHQGHEDEFAMLISAYASKNRTVSETTGVEAFCDTFKLWKTTPEALWGVSEVDQSPAVQRVIETAAKFFQREQNGQHYLRLYWPRSFVDAAPVQYPQHYQDISISGPTLTYQELLSAYQRLLPKITASDNGPLYRFYAFLYGQPIRGDGDLPVYKGLDRFITYRPIFRPWLSEVAAQRARRQSREEKIKTIRWQLVLDHLPQVARFLPGFRDRYRAFFPPSATAAFLQETLMGDLLRCLDDTDEPRTGKEADLPRRLFVRNLFLQADTPELLGKLWREFGRPAGMPMRSNAQPVRRAA